MSKTTEHILKTGMTIGNDYIDCDYPYDEYIQKINRLKGILSVPTKTWEEQELIQYIVDNTTDFDTMDIDDLGNIYITKGKADVYPCVVAHTDTVHDIYKGYKVYEVEGNFVAFDSATMQQVGTGGDDKVGLWICLEMLRSYDNIKICFFGT